METLIIGGCGYTGSRLFESLSAHETDTVDLEWFGNAISPRNYKMDFRYLDKTMLGKYKTIVLVAGHSSVGMCQSDRKSSFANNVSNFIDLLDKLSSQKFIYISSSSVYCSGVNNKEDDSTYVPQNYYDLTKKIIDYYAILSKVEYYGLRLGTVCGPSKNLRTDLMINKMYEDAKATGAITVYNPEISRPILGINDLCRAIAAIMESEPKPGIYNLASCTSTVGEIAKAVSAETGATIHVFQGNTSYDFSIDTTKFKNAFNFEFKDDVAKIIADLKAADPHCIKGGRERTWQYV